MSFAIQVCIKITMLLICAGLLSAMLRRASASARHALWAAALLAVAVFPVISIVLPTLDLAILPENFANSDVRSVEVAPPAPSGAISITPAMTAPPAVEAVPSWNWTGWIALFWALGSCIVVLQSLAALWELHRLKMTSEQPADGSWSGLLAGMRSELSISKPVQLRIATNPGPLACGIFRHVILLPEAAEEWGVARRRLVLAHEMAHVKRNDGLGQVLCQVVCALYWFNPVVWYGVRQLRIERERACDDYVLGLGGSAPDYADHLLQIARGLNAGFGLTAVSMAHPSQLKSRVMAILDSGMRRKRMSRVITVTLLFTTAALTLSLASIHLTALSAAPLPAVLMPLTAPTMVEPPVVVAAPKPAAIRPQETSPGYVVNRAPTSYPSEALQKRIEGTVVVELSFNAQGQIVDSHVLSGPEELRQTALQTALQGKYGINLARSLQVVVDFKLPAAGTAQIGGRLVDPSGVPLPGVTIAATNTQNGTVTTALSNSLGEYYFRQLPAGTYRLRAEFNGFQTRAFENVQLGDSQQVRLNFTLQPGVGTYPSVAAFSPSAALPRTQLNPGVLESIAMSGSLPEPLFSEMRQRLQAFKGQVITSDLLNDIRASIKASSWGEKPVGFVVSSKTATSSDLLITFYDSPTAPSRVRVGGNVMASNLIQQVKPNYPQQAKDAKIQGVVVLETDIGADGAVSGVRVITGHPLLIQAAVDAVRQWVYKPTLLGGQPVEVVTTVTVNFAMQE